MLLIDMYRSISIPIFFISLLAAACGGGEWVGEGTEGLGTAAWPDELAGAWVQEIEACPGSTRRWDFFPPDTFVETVDDPFHCAGQEGEWYGGMSAGAGGLLDLTSEGPERFRRFVVSVADGRLNTRTYADEGQGRCFFRHRWQTHLAEDFYERRTGVRLCFSQALPEGQRPVMVDVQLWLYDDRGTNAIAASVRWSWTWALQNEVDEDGDRVLWPEGMERQELVDDWLDFLRREMADGARMSSAAAQEMLPLWRWDGERLTEDAPEAWMEKL